MNTHEFLKHKQKLLFLNFGPSLKNCTGFTGYITQGGEGSGGNAMCWIGGEPEGPERSSSAARRGLGKEQSRADMWARRIRNWRHRQEMVKKQARVGLLPQGRHLMDWYPPHPPQGLMGENLLGLPDSCLRGLTCLWEGGSALVNLSCIQEGREAWHFPNPWKWKKKGFFAFRATSWMTEVSVCNWSVWAQAPNYFLDNLLSISHQAACQHMLMSPEWLVWILKSRLLCFCFLKGK